MQIVGTGPQGRPEGLYGNGAVAKQAVDDDLVVARGRNGIFAARILPGAAQSKTRKPVRFEITETARASVGRCAALLGHTKMDRTVHYLGVDLDDALSLSEGIDL